VKTLFPSSAKSRRIGRSGLSDASKRPPVRDAAPSAWQYQMPQAPRHACNARGLAEVPCPAQTVGSVGARRDRPVPPIGPIASAISPGSAHRASTPSWSVLELSGVKKNHIDNLLRNNTLTVI
jgi:hypothetical protein